MENKWKCILYCCVFVFSVVLLAAINTGCEVPEEPEMVDNSEVVLKSKSILPEFPEPDVFVTGFSNPYLAFEVGKVFYYEGETEDGFETIKVEVTDQTKWIMGVKTTVVTDSAFLDGELIEATDDWFAEDDEGNVWYFGEYSEEWEDGEFVGTEGSWEAGDDGALPGILMPGTPEMGMKYQQEFYEDEAEDMAKVINLKKTVEIEMGTYTGCLETMEWTPLEPGEREHKFYKPGVGLLLELKPRGGRITIELVEIEGS